jgi:hypothetical protein
VALAAGCLEERLRPAPPVLTLVLARGEVCSPDTVAGTLRARDPDGIDSVWIRVDDREEAWDGLLGTVFELAFELPVRGGLGAGAEVPVWARARDLAGFSDTLERRLPVVACAPQRLN